MQVSQGLVITYRIMTEALAHLWVGLAKRRSPSAIRIQRMALTSWALSVINLHSTSDVKCYLFPVLNYFAQMAWCCLKVAIAPFVRNNGATEQWPNVHWCMQHLLQCHQLFSCVYFFLDRVSSCSSSTVWWAQRQVWIKLKEIIGNNSETWDEKNQTSSLGFEPKTPTFRADALQTELWGQRYSLRFSLRTTFFSWCCIDAQLGKVTNRIFGKFPWSPQRSDSESLTTTLVIIVKVLMNCCW